jgi:hypothetical protein
MISGDQVREPLRANKARAKDTTAYRRRLLLVCTQYVRIWTVHCALLASTVVNTPETMFPNPWSHEIQGSNKCNGDISTAIFLGLTDASLFSSRLIEERTVSRFFPAVIHCGNRENIDQCLLEVRSRKPAATYALSLVRCSALYAQSM